MSSGNKPEKPKKAWKCYSGLKDYILRNFDKADCSFVISDPTGNINSERELRSYKWMLCEFSPVLKGILSDEKHKAKNFKMIPVPDKHFGALLWFVHTKTVRDGSFSYLLDLYETAMRYEAILLREAIMSKLHHTDPVGNWIRFAELAWRERKTFSALKETLRYMLYTYSDWKRAAECELASNDGVEALLRFEFTDFYDFFYFLQDYLNPLVAFKIGEAYLLKNIFKGRTPGKIEEEDILSIIVVNEFLNRVNFDQITVEEFDNGPAQSALLSEESKKRYRGKVRK